MNIFIQLVVLLIIDYHVINADAVRKIRGTVPGTGWTSLEYFSREFTDPGIQDVSGIYNNAENPQQVQGNELTENYPEPYNEVVFKAGPSSTEQILFSPKLIERNGYTKRDQSIEVIGFLPSLQAEHYIYPLKIKSKFICPQNDIAGYKRFAYSKVHNKCFELGYKGPCKSNMKFLADRVGSELGTCDCDPDVGYSCGRPLVYWTQDDWCYPVYSQGPCYHNEWLVLDQNGQPYCELNRCKWEQAFDKILQTDCQHWVYMKGNCHQTSTRAFCQHGEVLFWDVYDTKAAEPTCLSSWSYQTDFLNYKIDKRRIDETLPCFPGQKQTIERRCQPNY